MGQKHQTDAEEDRQDDPEGAVVGHPRPPHDQLHRQRSNPTRQTCTDHQNQRHLGSGEHEGEDDPRQCSVTDSVAEQTLAT